jgi:hypothetical protein
MTDSELIMSRCWLDNLDDKTSWKCSAFLSCHPRSAKATSVQINKTTTASLASLPRFDHKINLTAFWSYFALAAWLGYIQLLPTTFNRMRMGAPLPVV